MIRQANPHDKSIIAEMLYDMYLQHHNAKPDFISCHANKNDFLPKLDRVFSYDHLTHFVYEKNSVVQAYMMISEKDHPDHLVFDTKMTITLDVIVTHPEYRKQGIASQMIVFAKKYAAEKGYTKLALDVMEGFPDTKALYQKHGFGTICHAMLADVRTMED